MGKSRGKEKNMKPEKDNTFCWYPFTLLALKEWRYDKGIVNASPCCNSIRPETPDPLNIKSKIQENPNSIMPTDIFHGEEMESIRQAMREGRKHPACNTCWKMEERGNGRSYRFHSSPSGIDSKHEDNQDLIANPQLRSIDFAFGENCNLRCRMCAPGLSNKLRIDLQYFLENGLDTSGLGWFDYRTELHDGRTVEDIKENHEWFKPDSSTSVYNWADNEQWQNILDNIHTLNHIKATGGETTISKPFLQFLDTAVERGVSQNIMLEFHTNATKFTNELLDKMDQFGGLHLNLSIDSVDKNYEYCRYPMLWNKLDSSLRRLLNRRNKNLRNFSFNPVMSVLNVHYLPRLLEYQQSLVDEYTHMNYSSFWVDLLWPEYKYINVKFLSPEVKQELIDELSMMQSENINVQIDQSVDFLRAWQHYEPTEQERLNMLREITVFDKSRNQTFHDYLHPDIVKFLETPR